jgi:seryl-tRNA synthetase
MLDIDFVRNHPDIVKKAIADKNIGLDLDEFISLDGKRRQLIKNIDDLRCRQNDFNKKVIRLQGSEKQSALDDIKAVSINLKESEKEIKEIGGVWSDMYALVPNIASSDTPVGMDERANVEVEKWGDLPKFDFDIKSHLQLGRDLDIIDFERGVNTSGFRGYYLKNEGAILHLAVLNYALKKIVGNGFTPMITPVIIRDFALLGSGHFPFGREDIYELANTGKDKSGKDLGEKLYLAGTSEPSLLAYFAGETLDESDLPKKVCGYSQCFRNEVGSYGKDTKGLYRIHEFSKVEQVVICRADEKESEQWLQKMRGYAQEVLRELGLPHRVLQICTGDMGAGKRKMYDLETWMPSRDGYGETHSDSDLTDWQTRRLNIKYKTKDGEKKHPYALNNTVIASPRILIAILENFQQKDGSVKIPEPLVDFCGFDKISPKK